MKIRYLLLICIAGAIVTLDQLTKLQIHTSFHEGESVVLIPGYFSLTYVRNFGAAFGIFQMAPELFREIFFLSVPPIALVVILWFLKSVDDSDKFHIVTFSLIAGGAIGNYIDRLRFRYVVDFIDVYYQGHHWPAFNIADSSIVVGGSLLLIVGYWENLKSKKSQN